MRVRNDAKADYGLLARQRGTPFIPPLPTRCSEQILVVAPLQSAVSSIIHYKKWILKKRISKEPLKGKSKS